MTKKSLLLVSLLLAFGLVAMAPSALAQTQWFPGSNAYAGGRCQGKAEATGQFTLQQLLGGTVGSGTYFQITYTQPVVELGTVTLQCSSTYASNPWYGPPYPLCSLAASGGLTTSLDPTRTILTITFTHQVAFPAATSSVLAITARVDATSECSATVGAVQASVYAYSPNPIYSLTINGGNPSIEYNVLKVNPDPALTLAFGNYCYWEDGPAGEKCKPASTTAYVLLCLGVIDNNKQYERYFTVAVGEKFMHALTSSAYESQLDPGSSSPGVVTNPTSITVVLSNIPTGFGIAPGDPVPCSVVTAPATPCPSGTLLVGYPSGGPYWNSTPGNTGTEQFEFPVETVSSVNGEYVELPFKFYSAGPITGAPPVSPWCVTLSIYKDPNPTLDAGAANDIPYFNTLSEGSLPVICFNNCETNLLFPFIINYGAWDSIVAISNTTMDPLALIGAAATPPNLLLEKGSATRQSGVCYYYYFSGGTLANSWVTKNPIVAGSTQSDQLGYEGLINGSTFGYLWVKCEFSQAYGYAAIAYDFTTPTGILADYLAVTIPDPEWSPRDQNGDGMGENSSTPLNLTKMLKYYLAGFKNII